MARWNAFSEDTGLLVDAVRIASHPLETPQDFDALIKRIGDAHYVLLGEASHGTSDFYKWRALLSQRLIRDKGFNFIAVEGDWPDCYRINRYIKGYSGVEASAFKVLNAFDRWPTWMWANWEIVALTEWMRSFNARSGRRVGFYGLDVYSLYESMHTIVDYLEKKDPEMARLAQQAYRCFEPYAEDVQSYAWSTRMVPETCESEVIDLLKQLQNRAPHYDGDPEAGFNTEQNALVMVDAEKYYRAMVRSDENSWNVRDIHMADTLDRLVELHGLGAKAIIWAHNTHVGDARYTDMAASGMVNIGQLVRERKGEDDTCLVGFGTHHGTVIAGKDWDAPMEVMGVPDAVENSWEDVLHRTAQNAFYLLLQEKRKENIFTRERGNRAIGVVYNPESERFGNYVPSHLPQRYDAFTFIDETQALHPLHDEPEKEPGVPETYPWGL
jgi:erythromycin esterase